MNKGCEAADVFESEYISELKVQDGVSRKANKWIFNHKDKEISHPNEDFYKLLEERYEEPVFRTKALVLKVKLDLENFDIWRKVIVPLDMSFYELHKIIQAAFDWGYQHLLEFVIYSQEKPLARISSDDDFESVPNEEDIYSESTTRISEFIPKYKNIEYIYDFGDYWVHNIIIEEVLFDYDKNYAICSDGKNDRPPEDVGGEGGYEELVKVINDPNHDEYEHIKGWYESQHYKGFDIDLVNRRLKHLY